MSTRYIYPVCPACDESLEIACEYEAADPEVGLRAGLVLPETPDTCPNCGCAYNEAGRARLTTNILRAADQWDDA